MSSLLVRVRNQAVRDWNLSFLRQKFWAWIFGGEGLGASLCLVEHVSTMLPKAENPRFGFLSGVRWLEAE